MNKATILLSSLLISVSVYAQIPVIKQDTILRLNGDEIFGKVTEVTPDYIVCQIVDSTQIINQVIPRDDLFMIKYSNGTKELITLTKTENKFSPKEMFDKGQNDANLLYNGTGPMLGTLAATVLYPPAGLIEGVISGSIPPKTKNFVVTDMNLLNNKDYISGYKNQAHKKKTKKVFMGFGLGLVPWIIGIVIINGNY